MHVVAAYSPWLNGLLEGSNGILVNALKRLCAPGLGKDDYMVMQVKYIPSNWPIHLDAAIKSLSDHILPALKYLPNELLLGLPVNLQPINNLEDIAPPSENKVAIHLAFAKQQCLDGYSAIVNHAAKRKQKFDSKLLKCTPGNVRFNIDNLVQVHTTKWVHTLTAIKKLISMWSPPHCVGSKMWNPYTLETLDGNLMDSVFKGRQLRTFEPQDGTRLAFGKLVRENKLDDEEDEEV